MNQERPLKDIFTINVSPLFAFIFTAEFVNSNFKSAYGIYLHSAHANLAWPSMHISAFVLGLLFAVEWQKMQGVTYSIIIALIRFARSYKFTAIRGRYPGEKIA